MKHIEEIVLPAPPEDVFAALTTPSAIRAWWGASRAVVLARPGGAWAMAWGAEDEPDYISTSVIAEIEPPRRMVVVGQRYFARENPPEFEPDLTTEFSIEEHPDGSLLRVVNDGFPDGEAGSEFLAACGRGWRSTLSSMRDFLAEGGT